MKKHEIERRPLLSTLWIFVLFNMIFRDLHQFANAGFVQELMSLEVREELVLVFGFVLEIPIAMVLLSRILRDKANKWVNFLAVVITLLGILSALPSADMDDVFFAVMESAALVAIILVSWRLPSQSKLRL
ncbi:DUF6326 family protein [Flagellimonas allohymeniacidonis]|uniref:DoxX family protein n=1 Tax=Flagellimonas allohymeniacidonis TaxID=2517819 RepID=A0A4Q8QJS2_9FLAO|nr:DUF6326 family protein [Allomuricauda hymeniacidonis]TAI49003.1 hypothetical protein EW142_04195 [Allomuricauda hymeniacidonis]